MPSTRLALLIAVAALSGSIACTGSPAAAPGDVEPSANPAAAMAAAHGTTAAAGADAGVPAGTATGIVAETMDSGGYTYARLTIGDKDVWIAATEFEAATGDRVTVALDMPMENFRSRTLNRDFPLIYFVSGVARDGAPLPASTAAAGTPALVGSHAEAPAAQAPVAAVAPPAGGISVADLWAKREALSGKPVLLRGTVVRANNAIMGRNWFHLQDGSGTAADGTNDLTVTTTDTVTVGDVVTVSGTLSTGKDFGAGYVYEAIVEDARVSGK